MPPTLRTFRKTFKSVRQSDVSEMDHFYLNVKSFQKDSRNLKFVSCQEPESLGHFHILNPSFSGEHSHEDAVNLYPFWLVRDGFIPLVVFFRSSPATHQSTLLYHENFSFLIPSQNKKTAYLYGISHRPCYPKTKRDKVIVSGILNAANFSLDYLEKQITKISRSLEKKKLTWEGVYFNFYIRENRYFKVDPERVNPIFFYIKAIDRLTKGKAQFLTEKDMFNIDSFFEWFYVCLHERNILISDNYIEHLISSKGGIPLFAKKKREKEKSLSIPISPYHDYVIREFQYDRKQCRFESINRMFDFFLDCGSEEELLCGDFFFYARDFLRQQEERK